MKKILLAMDGSENSFKAVDEAAKLAKALKADITVLSVIPVETSPLYAYDRASYGESSEQVGMLVNMSEKMEKEAKELLQKVEEIFLKKGINAKATVSKGHPADNICKYAEEGGFDLIVMGRKGLGGLKRFLLGSVSSSVAQCAKTSVLIVK